MELTQVAQHADDLDQAAQFYSVLLRTQPAAIFDPPGLCFYNLDGTRLLLDRAAPSALLYFPTDDLDTEITRLELAGGTPDTPPHMIFRHDDATLGPAGKEEWQAFIRDPEGNLVGLIEHRQPG